MENTSVQAHEISIYLFIDEVIKVLKGDIHLIQCADLDAPINGTCFRQFYKEIFYIIGVEIEFSGKKEEEKGVLIDIDEAVLERLGLQNHTLRFGQNMIKTSAKNCENEHNMNINTQIYTDTTLKEYILKALQN